MFNRNLIPQPVVIPKGSVTPPSPTFLDPNVAYTPGQNAAIRFFDPYAMSDLLAMREILNGKQVKKWMDNTQVMTQTEYREWAGSPSLTSYLFAALDARMPTPEERKRIHGFVYIYSEREEKFRVKRMEKQGFLPPARKARYALEVSFAVRPQVAGVQAGSGLMSSALRQSCMQIYRILNSLESCEVVIFGFVDQENLPAQRTLEASGFVRQGVMRYDWDSPDDTYLYILNWRVLNQKLKDKLLEVAQK